MTRSSPSSSRPARLACCAAYLLTGDRHTAEDAAQTALARTYAAWSRVRRQDAFACTRRVLVNHVTDRWRWRLREYATGTLPDRAATADIAEEVPLRQWLITVLASLTRRERAVVIMRYYFDLPEAVVAYELQISTGTVKSTSARALAKLRIPADPPGPAGVSRGCASPGRSLQCGCQPAGGDGSSPATRTCGRS